VRQAVYGWATTVALGVLMQSKHLIVDDLVVVSQRLGAPLLFMVLGIKESILLKNGRQGPVRVLLTERLLK